MSGISGQPRKSPDPASDGAPSTRTVVLGPDLPSQRHPSGIELAVGIDRAAILRLGGVHPCRIGPENGSFPRVWLAEREGFSAVFPNPKGFFGFPDPFSSSCVSLACIPGNQERSAVLQLIHRARSLLARLASTSIMIATLRSIR
jgi:hypothetical protein